LDAIGTSTTLESNKSLPGIDYDARGSDGDAGSLCVLGAASWPFPLRSIYSSL
jgi:hypothetical protein